MRKDLLCLFVALSASLPMMARTLRAAEGPVITASATTENPVQQPSEVREFEVRVDDKPRGIHCLTIKSDGEKSEVAFQTDVKIDFIVYAYVFKFRGTEVWRDGRVESTEIHCEDGSRKRSFCLKTDGDAQQIQFNNKLVTASSVGTMTTAYWQLPPAGLRSKPIGILDVDTGAIHSASFHCIGPTTVLCAGRTLECQHFKIDGPSPAELWFDDGNRLVRQRSMEQGHQMELRLKQIRTVTDER